MGRGLGKLRRLRGFRAGKTPFGPDPCTVLLPYLVDGFSEIRAGKTPFGPDPCTVLLPYLVDGFSEI